MPLGDEIKNEEMGMADRTTNADTSTHIDPETLHCTQWQGPKFLAVQYHKGNQQIIPTDDHRQSRDTANAGRAREENTPEKVK